MPPFLYFDLGNVVLFFDHRRAARQMAELAGVPEEIVWELVFAGKLGSRYERGQVSSREFHAVFCDATNTQPDFDLLMRAASDMFTLNTSLVPLLAALRRSGHALGLLSNTCDAHWKFVTDGRFAIVPNYFQTLALSFQLNELKPNPPIFAAAAKLANREAQDIFFVDDLPQNVAGAKAAGFDAVLFESAAQLARDLDARGIKFAL